MKTTIDISDNILLRAKDLAKKENITFKELTEEGLEHILKDRITRKKVKVKPILFSGKGLSPEYQDKSWNDIRKTVYDGNSAELHCRR